MSSIVSKISGGMLTRFPVLLAVTGGPTRRTVVTKDVFSTKAGRIRERGARKEAGDETRFKSKLVVFAAPKP